MPNYQIRVDNVARHAPFMLTLEVTSKQAKLLPTDASMILDVPTALRCENVLRKFAGPKVHAELGPVRLLKIYVCEDGKRDVEVEPEELFALINPAPAEAPTKPGKPSKADKPKDESTPAPPAPPPAPLAPPPPPGPPAAQ